jgi:hypothetical protein
LTPVLAHFSGLWRSLAGILRDLSLSLGFPASRIITLCLIGKETLPKAATLVLRVLFFSLS